MKIYKIIAVINLLIIYLQVLIQEDNHFKKFSSIALMVLFPIDLILFFMGVWSMSDEEIAIETLKEVASDDFDTLGDDISPKMAQNILNVIDKQKKEIEENREVLDFSNNEIIELKDMLIEKDKKIKDLSKYVYDKDFISKDKIREKIKELENKNEKNKIELAKGIDMLNFDTIEEARINISINVNTRDVLQELLEEN